MCHFQTSTVGFRRSSCDLVHTLQRERKTIWGGKNRHGQDPQVTNGWSALGCWNSCTCWRGISSPRVESCPPWRLRQPLEMLSAQFPPGLSRHVLTARGRGGRAGTCGRDYVSHSPLGGSWDSLEAALAKCGSQYMMSAQGWLGGDWVWVGALQRQQLSANSCSNVFSKRSKKTVAINYRVENTEAVTLMSS